MTKIFSLLLFALLMGASFAVSAADTAGSIPRSMSDDLFSSSAYNAGRSTGGDSFRPSFSTSDTSRLTIMGRFPMRTDLRHAATLPLGNDWKIGWTNDQYGRSLGLSRPVGTNGVARFGIMKENVSNVPNRTAAGASISFSW